MTQLPLNNNPKTVSSALIQESQSGKRLDTCLAEIFADFSRAYFQQIIEHAYVQVHGKTVTKGSYKVKMGDLITINFPPAREVEIAHLDTPAPFTIIFEHPDFFIIEKQAGIAVHPASASSKEPTLSDWLVATHSELAHVGQTSRAGIVHRLDKNTSGLMIIPRTAKAHALIGDMFKERKIKKTYYAFVQGSTPATGFFDYDIIRHHLLPHKMSAGRYTQGKKALTHFETVAQTATHSFVIIKPVTGRTHQIRVHFATAGYPLIGDTLYGWASQDIARHALHAAELAFVYNNEEFHFTTPLPEDMRILQQKLNLLPK